MSENNSFQTFLSVFSFLSLFKPENRLNVLFFSKNRHTKKLTNVDIAPTFFCDYPDIVPEGARMLQRHVHGSETMMGVGRRCLAHLGSTCLHGWATVSSMTNPVIILRTILARSNDVHSSLFQM